jgi:hypothetical protein
LVLTQHATAPSSWLAGSVCSPTGCAAPCCVKHRRQGSGCCRQASRHERCRRMWPKAPWTPSPSLVNQLPARRVQKDVKGTGGPKLTSVGCQVNIMTLIMSIGLSQVRTCQPMRPACSGCSQCLLQLHLLTWICCSYQHAPRYCCIKQLNTLRLSASPAGTQWPKQTVAFISSLA